MGGPPAGHPPTQPYNRRMHYLLVTLTFWVSRIAHWVGAHIYDKTTFGVVVAIGVFQTLVAWESGYLAVIALPREEATPRRKLKHKLSFALLATFLFGLTMTVGVLNDKSQHKEEDRASDAVARADGLQRTLNQQNQIIGKLGSDFLIFEETLKKGGSTDKLAGQLEQIQQTLKSAQAVTQPTAAAENPLSLMSNRELKDAVNDFIRRTRVENTKMYEIEDRVTRARDRLNYLPSSELPEAERYRKATEQDLTSEMNSFVQHYVPAANQYLVQLERRLNSQEHLPPFSADPTIPSLNAFTMHLGKLETLAAQLK